MLRHRNNPALSDAKWIPGLLEAAREAEDDGALEKAQKIVRQTLATALDKNETKLETYYALIMMDGDKMAFPNATVRADKHDADFWLSQANLDKAPADSKGFFQGAMASLNPYVQAQRFSAFDGTTTLVPGIQAVATRGHTAGHSTYVVESKGQKLVVWGDLIHVAAVQFDDPSVTIAFDSDAKNAAVHRKAAFADAAKGGYVVAAAHIAFPGLGRVRANGKAFSWVPVNYTVPR